MEELTKDLSNSKLEKLNPLNLIQEKEDVFLKLSCKDCDFIECGIKLNHTIIRGKEGCTKKVSEETAAKFYHYMKEVIPFWKLHDDNYVRESYKEIINFLYSEVYSAPIGQRLDPEGKVRASGY